MPDPQSTPPENERRSRDATGVLVVNLGTPDEPTPPAVRRYLRQFLSDPRVVEAPRWLWWLALNGIILRLRPARSAAAYRRIWTEAGSPLLVHSREIVQAMQRELDTRMPGRMLVELAMSYGQPAIGRALASLAERGASRVVLLPLYPQYAGSTTGSVFTAVTRELSQRRFVPGFRFINHYHDAPGYIAALAASIREFRQDNGRGERLLFSFHGLPRNMVDRGDPYREQCVKTAELVAGALQLDACDWMISFQSRVGREEWLRPYTDETLRKWGEQGMGKIDVICPGFAADCLETLEEIALRNAEHYVAAGGEALRYIPALNARQDHVAFLCELVSRQTPQDSGARPGDAPTPAPSANADRHAARNFGGLR